jgi:hypothetical protein
MVLQKTFGGKSTEDIAKALVSLVGDPGESAVTALSDPQAVYDDDLMNVLVKDGPKIPLGIFRKNVQKLRGTPLTQSAVTDQSRVASFDALPNVPEDTSFLEMLKIGGVLKVGPTEVMSAMKAGIGHYLGLYDLPDKIVERMEAFATTQDEPVGESFYKLRKLVVTRNYGEVLSVLNIEGSFASERRKREFLDKLNEGLWPALRGFHQQIVAWQDTWAAGATNPGMILAALAFGQSSKNMMPPGMLQPPDTATIRDEAESVINRINRVFSGVGIPIARALAYDATRIKSVIEDAALPAAIGATTKDQMLKTLGISVGADYVRLERNVTRYALAIIEYPKIPAGNEEYGYLGAMIQLGATIPWDKLPGGNSTGRNLPRSGRGALRDIGNEEQS